MSRNKKKLQADVPHSISNPPFPPSHGRRDYQALGTPSDQSIRSEIGPKRLQKESLRLLGACSKTLPRPPPDHLVRGPQTLQPVRGPPPRADACPSRSRQAGAPIAHPLEGSAKR